MASRPAFIKFFFPHNTADEMKIPSVFVHSIERGLPEHVILRDRYSNFWRVKVERGGDCFYFKDGWKIFVKDNLLRGGEVIVFEYFYKGRFDTKILGPNACESKAVGGPKQTNKAEHIKVMETDIGETDDGGYDGDVDAKYVFPRKIQQENQPDDGRREQVPDGMTVPQARRIEKQSEDSFTPSADRFTQKLKKKNPEINPVRHTIKPPKPKNNGAVPVVPPRRKNGNLQAAYRKALKNAAPVTTVDQPPIDVEEPPVKGPDSTGGDASPLARDEDAGTKELIRVVIEVTDEDETDDDHFVFTTRHENHRDHGRVLETSRASLKRKTREYESYDDEETTDDDDGDDDYTQNGGQDEPVQDGETSSRRRRDSYVNWRNLQWFGETIFRDRLAPRPVNPYFMAKRRTREAELYIPTQLMKLHKLDLPESLTLVDPRGGRFRARRKIWKDGRVFYSKGWRNLCGRNFVLKEDHCICEFVKVDGGDLELHVRIVRANEHG